MKTIISYVVIAFALILGTTAASHAEPRRAASAKAVDAPAPEAKVVKGKARPKLTGVANLNQADAETLELLPYVGPARAQQIVEWRKKRPFKRVEDLVRIKGIGKKTLARMRPYLTVSGATTLAETDPKDDPDFDQP